MAHPQIPQHSLAQLMSAQAQAHPTMAAQVQAQAQAQAQAQVQAQAQAQPSNAPDYDPYAESEYSEIRIRVQVPLTIRGDGNLITVDNSTNGNRLALGIVQAMNQLSIQSMGLPMIDEEGRPRPVKCDVNANIVVEGNNNVVGEKAVMATIEVNGGKAGRAAIFKNDIQDVSVEVNGSKAEKREKREREEDVSGDVEMKRTRHE